MAKTIETLTTTEEWKEFNKTKQVVVYFTIIDCQDEFTKNILDAMYKEFETFVEQNTTETKFGMVDLAKSETLADELKCSALSSFHGYIEKELISKTGQTREIEDLKFLCEELKTPENILPYKVKDEADFNKILEDNELVVCDFTASWCGPCQMIGPKFKEMAKEQVKTSKNMMGTTELVKFIKVEQTENKELVTKQGVTAYPTFHLYKNGTKKSEVKGVDEEGLKFAIKQLIDEDYKHWAEYSKTEADFDDIVAKNDLVFVDFTATWCPPCKMIGPIFEELATENKDKILNSKVKFVKIDVDENDAVSQKYAIRSMPTFKVFKNHEEVQEEGFSGASEEKLRAMVTKMIDGL